MQNLGFEQNLEQSLQMQLSPRLLGMLKILSLPYQEIISEVEKASEENPFVEIEKHETLTEYIRYLGTTDKKTKSSLDFSDHPGLENIKKSQNSLRDFLIEQLGYLTLDEESYKTAEALINDVDDSGYLKEYEESKNRIIDDLSVSENAVDKALVIVQSFEPEGVGARSIQECLLIQIREFGFENPELQKIIERMVKEYFEDIAKKDYEKIASGLGLTVSAVKEIIEFIKNNLNPYPASHFGDKTQNIIPSFAIEKTKEKDSFVFVNLEDKYGPKVSLSKDYQKMLKDPKTDAETVKFLREKLEKAKEMLENLSKRGETGNAIMEIILDVQKEFIDKGASFLMPLEQKDIAEKLGLHPSTISRAVAGKYVQTPKGLIPIKFLCQRKFRGHSPEAIKTRILEIVSCEDKSRPLSDEDIKGELLKQGIFIERRTVSSYRKNLGILSSEERSKL